MDISKSNITLAQALLEAKEYDTIYLGNRVFKEKVYITKPHITLIGDGAKIIYNASHGTIIPLEMGGDGIKTFGTTGSATFTVKEGADYFMATGITFINEFKRLGQKNGQAVAFKSEINHLRIFDCEFISEQDTLYIDNGYDNIIGNSKIFGDIDFIFGSASCLFYKCEIIAIDEGYFIAPDTYGSMPFGFYFLDCEFKKITDKHVYLGRRWFPGGAKDVVYPKASFKNCLFADGIELDLIEMHKGDPSGYSLEIIDCMLDKKIISKNINEK